MDKCKTVQDMLLKVWCEVRCLRKKKRSEEEDVDITLKERVFNDLDTGAAIENHCCQ